MRHNLTTWIQRTGIDDARHLRDEIDKRVGNINAIYRKMDWIPIHYYYRSFFIEMISAL